MAPVALAWVASRPGVPSALVGASRVEQLLQNIASLDISFTAEQKERLDALSQMPMLSPYFIFQLLGAHLWRAGRDAMGFVTSTTA